MIYSTNELKQKLGGFFQINEALKRGDYFRIARGLYSDESPLLNELETLFAKYPNAVLTLESAFDYYEMSDYVPNKYIIATSQKAHKISNPKVEQIYMTKELLEIGKTVIQTKHGHINIYDLERLLIELFRFKSRLDFSYYKSIVNSYRQLIKEEKIDSHKLVKYCSHFINGENILRQIMEVVL